MEKMFSIIVVCYNAGDKLRNTIQNILQQTSKDYEILIKDAMSTDGSLDAIPMCEEIRILRTQDKGIYDGMNQAIQEAKGKFLFFLNCGDYFYQNDVLAEVAKKITESPNRGIYYGDTFYEVARTVVPLPKEITAFTCYRHIPCHQACIYEKPLFLEKKYDLHYKIRADYDHFLWCFFEKGIRPYHIGFPVASYEGGGYSESPQNHKRDQDEHKEIVNKYMKRSQLWRYKAFMVLTLAPLRRVISNSRYFSGVYEGIKNKIYR